MEVIIMTGVNDLNTEMINVQNQIGLLKKKTKKTAEDIEEILILSRYYNILFDDYMKKSII